MVYLIILSVVLSVVMSVFAAKKAKELPDSVSSFSYYVGGYLFGLASQIVVALLIPWLLMLWVLFPLVFTRKSWKENATFIAEGICYITLVGSLIISLLS